MGKKVECKYQLQEKFGVDTYEITLDSPGFNQPINWFYANCKISNTKKIAKLQSKGKQIRDKYIAQDNCEWEDL